MKKYDSKLIGKIAFCTTATAIVGYLLLVKTSLNSAFIFYNFSVCFFSFLATVGFVSAEYIKNEFIEKKWFSKLLSFFADLMLISFVMAILYLFISVEKLGYQITLMTLPFLSAFIALFTDKYRPFLVKFADARSKQDAKTKELFRLSAERAIQIRKEREERKKRIEAKRIAKLKRKKLP